MKTEIIVLKERIQVTAHTESGGVKVQERLPSHSDNPQATEVRLTDFNRRNFVVLTFGSNRFSSR
jgi:hypothetical protein